MVLRTAAVAPLLAALLPFRQVRAGLTGAPVAFVPCVRPERYALGKSGAIGPSVDQWQWPCRWQWPRPRSRVRRPVGGVGAVAGEAGQGEADQADRADAEQAARDEREPGAGDAGYRARPDLAGRGPDAVAEQLHAGE